MWLKIIWVAEMCLFGVSSRKGFFGRTHHAACTATSWFRDFATGKFERVGNRKRRVAKSETKRHIKDMNTLIENWDSNESFIWISLLFYLRRRTLWLRASSNGCHRATILISRILVKRMTLRCDRCQSFIKGYCLFSDTFLKWAHDELELPE